MPEKTRERNTTGLTTHAQSHKNYKRKIEALRQQSIEQMVRERAASSSPGEKTDASRDLVILAKDRPIKALEEENRQLKKQLQTALGKAYDQFS